MNTHITKCKMVNILGRMKPYYVDSGPQFETKMDRNNGKFSMLFLQISNTGENVYGFPRITLAQYLTHSLWERKAASLIRIRQQWEQHKPGSVALKVEVQFISFLLSHDQKYAT